MVGRILYRRKMQNILNESVKETCKYGHSTKQTQVQISIVCLYLTFGTAAFLSNIFIDFVIWKLHLYRVVGHLFILSLSVSDIIQGIMITAIYTTELLTGDDVHLSRGQSWCRFSAGVALLAILSTVYNICLITVDRMIAIFLPFRYHEIMNKRRAKIIVAVLWLHMIIWCSLPLLGWAKRSQCIRPPNTICDWGVTLDNTYFSITGVLVVISVLAVAIQQVAILFVALRHIKAIKVQPGRCRISISTMQSKVTRRVSFIVLTFAMTYIPWFFVVVRTLVSGLGGQSYIYMCNFLIFLNSFLNPWIYALTDREIRKKMKVIIFSLGRSRVTPFLSQPSLDEQQRERIKVVFSIAKN